MHCEKGGVSLFLPSLSSLSALYRWAVLMVLIWMVENGNQPTLQVKQSFIPRALSRPSHYLKEGVWRTSKPTSHSLPNWFHHLPQSAIRRKHPTFLLNIIWCLITLIFKPKLHSQNQFDFLFQKQLLFLLLSSQTSAQLGWVFPGPKGAPGRTVVGRGPAGLGQRFLWICFSLWQAAGQRFPTKAFTDAALNMTHKSPFTPLADFYSPLLSTPWPHTVTHQIL